MAPTIASTSPPGKEWQCVFSKCRRYRYVLWRQWGQAMKPYVMFIGLNPSTADDTQNDPTVRRCIGFAHDWGYPAMCMTNLFAYRATDPNDMKSNDEPVGEKNDYWLKKIAEGADLIVAAWGVHGQYLDRGAAVEKIIPALHCLGTTKQGDPRHPLYLPGDSKPVLLQRSSIETEL